MWLQKHMNNQHLVQSGLEVRSTVLSFHALQNTVKFHYIVSDQTDKPNALTSLHK